MSFKDLSYEERREVAYRGGIAGRSPELKRAWRQADKIRHESRYMPKAELARKYKINIRTLYRIVNGK